MQNGREPNLIKVKRGIAISAIGLLILVGFISTIRLNTSFEDRDPPAIVMRVDDIQDFAFREAQLFLLNESMINQVPLSLAIIAGMFGKDSEIVQTVRLVVSSGSEAAVHGWKHEDIATLPFGEQAELLGRSKIQIKETLGYDVEVFVPPMFSFNQDTIAAMLEEGYSTLSASTEIGEPGSISKVISLPATVELSDFSKGIWTMKNLNSVEAEISRSIEKYGFAIIVTHPQEFIAEGMLNQISTEFYGNLVSSLKKSYTFTTLERLGNIKITTQLKSARNLKPFIGLVEVNK